MSSGLLLKFSAILPILGGMALIYQNSAPTSDSSRATTITEERSAANLTKRPPGETASFGSLETWAATDPRAALGWLVKQNKETQIVRGKEAWRGVTTCPALALEIGNELQSSLPADLAALHGFWLTGCLAESGLADQAIAFALDFPGELPADWLKEILTIETTRSPESAVKLWKHLPNGQAKLRAWTAITATWASQDCAGLCAHALTLPPSSPERAEALLAGMNSSCTSDAPGYTEWLNTIEVQDEYDHALALLVTGTDTLFRSTTDALKWAELISDSDLRLSSVSTILHGWAKEQPGQAENWIASTPWLTEDQRARLESSLRPAFVPAD
jgi:hypothetical protein